VRTVDAVVIGAGHNGLVAANLLADAGWQVLVLEATGEAGGSVSSAEVTPPGFRSDLCSAFYPLGAGSPVLRELDLESHGLVWRHAPAVLAHVLPDDRCAVMYRDVAQTAESLAAFDPADARAWREEVDRWRRLGEPLLERAGMMPYAVRNTLQDPSAPHGLCSYWKSDYLTGLPDDLIDLMVDRAVRMTLPVSMLHLY